MINFRILLLSILLYASKSAQQDLSDGEILEYKEKIQRMFHHAYDSYIRYAYPYDELRPLTCDGFDTWGSFALTLIDSLDALVVFGNYTEFQRVVKLLEAIDFDQDINVSVFETNIRVVGGLLGAHLLSRRGGVDVEPGWPCDGPLLRLAEKVGRKLLAAFDTPTGMPYGTIRLSNGGTVPENETTVTCTAGVGSFIVEFATLSRLTGDASFELAARRALDALWDARSPRGLFGNHIDIASGKWTALDANIGSSSDSYFEYLVKGAILTGDNTLMSRFHASREAIESALRFGDWYVFAHYEKAQVSLPAFSSLDAFWPGLLTLVGDLANASRVLHQFNAVWRQYGSLPEFYHVMNREPLRGRSGYPLRPELAESIMYTYRATRDRSVLRLATSITDSIERLARTSCGYATLEDVTTHQLANRMESFFIAETLKYLYLTFDESHFLHNDGQRGTRIAQSGGECIVETSYVYNTEAHPVDLGSLACCNDFRARKRQQTKAAAAKEAKKTRNLRKPLDFNSLNWYDHLTVRLFGNTASLLSEDEETISELISSVEMLTELTQSIECLTFSAASPLAAVLLDKRDVVQLFNDYFESLASSARSSTRELMRLLNLRFRMYIAARTDLPHSTWWLFRAVYPQYQFTFLTVDHFDWYRPDTIGTVTSQSALNSEYFVATQTESCSTRSSLQCDLPSLRSTLNLGGYSVE